MCASFPSAGSGRERAGLHAVEVCSERRLHGARDDASLRVSRGGRHRGRRACRMKVTARSPISAVAGDALDFLSAPHVPVSGRLDVLAAATSGAPLPLLARWAGLYIFVFVACGGYVPCIP